jgi:acyl carrier protein
MHLHNLTRDMSLDYFVLFSSVTTLFGNPGQGNYVLANGYLEGLARMRRSAGLPALAVGFGAISDVGVVARSRALQDNLSNTTGARGMTSAEALELMKQALQRFGNDPAVAAVAISPTSGAFSFDRLPVLRSPTFAAFVSEAAGGGEAVAIDLARLLEQRGIEEARETVIGLVAGQVARVLRAKEEALSRTRALTEMGLDSLMALELGMNLEKTFGIDIPLTVSAADLTIAKLGDRILALASRGQIEPDEHADRLVAPHLQDARPEQIDALGEIIAARKSR